MRWDGVLYVLSQDTPDTEVSTVAVSDKFKKDDEKARCHIVLDVEEEPDMLITSPVLSGPPTKGVLRNADKCASKRKYSIQAKYMTHYM